MYAKADFLRAILAKPKDRTLLLVYADWLDEHDDPEQAARIRFAVGNPGKHAARDRQQMPFINAFDREYDRLRSAAGYPRVGFRRGVVEDIGGPLSAWVRHGDRLVAEHPIRSVAVNRAHGGVVRVARGVYALAGDPKGVRFRGSDLEGRPGGRKFTKAMLMRRWPGILFRMSRTSMMTPMS